MRWVLIFCEVNGRMRRHGFQRPVLIEAAQADNPPSKVKYDPQRDNAKISSLGVMEHWNNSTEKKYSRNLGKKEGIELVQNTINEKNKYLNRIVPEKLAIAKII